MSNQEYVDDCTLLFLTNERMMETISEKINKKDTKNKKFYKKRIFQTTKDILGNNCQEIPEYIVNSFDAYAKDLINYFRAIDSNDLNQSDYNGVSTRNNDLNISENIDEDLHTVTMKTCNIKEKNVLEKMVTKQKIKKEKEIILPRKKTIDLKSPTLRTKGVREKKNLCNKYDEQIKEKPPQIKETPSQIKENKEKNH